MFSRQLIIYFLLCLIAIAMVKEFSLDPDVISGNGNPVILIYPFAILTFCLFGIELYLRLVHSLFQPRTWRILFFVSLIVLITAIGFEFFFVKDLILALGGPPTNVNSRIYGFSWLNQYTNTIFVNYYTYLIYISIIMFSISLFRLKRF